MAEHPELHLIWNYSTIFIKPIPRYVLSHAFWKLMIREADNPAYGAILTSAAGFLRSYSYLVRYESDFEILQDKKLIPSNLNITYASFMTFINAFAALSDAHTSPRYHFGELRLTRINTYSRLFFQKLTFHDVNTQWSTFFGAFLAPLLTVFAILTVVLSARQVELAVESNKTLTFTPPGFSSVSRWFAVVTLFAAGLVIAGVAVAAVIFFCTMCGLREV
jgi:hypothetical protein